MNDQKFKKCKVKCISDDKSIYFKKGMVYDAYIPLCDGGKGYLAFYFTEEEMGEEGFYALPAYHFRIIEE